MQADDKIVHGSRQCFSSLNSEAQGFYLFIESVCEQGLERETWNLSSHEPFLYFLFSASASALDAAASLGGKDLIPFYNLLDGGREGEFFRVILLPVSVHIWLGFKIHSYRPDTSLFSVRLALSCNLLDVPVSKS